MNKKMKWVGMLASACVFACGFGIYNASRVQAQANETAELWKGFAITGTAVRTQDPVGLRFKTDVERLTPTMKKYNPDAEYYTVLTLTTGGKEYTTTRYADVWRPDGSGWNTVLLGIPESDYETKVTAQSFVKLNGKEQAFYQTQPVTISISQAAAAAMSYGATSEYITQYVDEIVTGVTLDQTSATLEVGQTVALIATTSPSGYMAKWTSSNESVATVDVKGNVKGKGVGTTTITAEINDYVATCQITVTERKELIEDFNSQQTPSFIGFVKNSNSQNQSFKTGYSGNSADKAFCLHEQKNLFGGGVNYPQFYIDGTWLTAMFANESVQAIAFDLKGEANGDRAITAKSTNHIAGLRTINNQWVTVQIPRAGYDVWKASGEEHLVYTWQNTDAADGGCGPVKAYFDNFRFVFAEDLEESEVLTDAELAELGIRVPNAWTEEKSFEFYGYASITNGKWKEYNPSTGEYEEVFGGEDYRSTYRIEEYKEAGMTLLFPQDACSIGSNASDNFTLASTTLEDVMNKAVEAGLPKVVVTDRRLHELIKSSDNGLVGAGKQFATIADLDAKITKWIQPYASHEAFYGVMLEDEPLYAWLKGYGEVYQSIKRCFPEAYIQCNLYPPVGNAVSTAETQKAFPMPQDATVAKYSAYGYDADLAYRFAAFDEYLNAFLDETGADYIMFDQYPITDAGLYKTFVAGVQVAANICAARNVKFHFVSQTMTMQQGAEDTNSRILTEEDLRWLNNMMLGFGVNEMAYFTYFTKPANSESERFLDGGSFITNHGEKTDIYYAMREILAENQAFAPVILSFDYKSSATYVADYAKYDSNNAQNCISGTFEKIASVEINKESALITELYDKNSGQYMYMAQNLIDPKYQGASTLQTTAITFNDDCEYAIVYKNGERKFVKLENNTFVAKLQSGEAVYVIPFNPKDNSFYDGDKGDNGVWFPGGVRA